MNDASCVYAPADLSRIHSKLQGTWENVYVSTEELEWNGGEGCFGEPALVDVTYGDEQRRGE